VRNVHGSGVLRNSRRPAAAVLALLVGSAAAMAKEPARGGHDDQSLADLLTLEVPSVYSASKRTQKITEAPAAITIITADEIRKHGYRTLAEALPSVRGFYVSYDRNYSYLGVRGFARPGDYNSRALLLVDGHRINDNVYDSALVGTEFPLDLDLVERIEVVRGPGSSLYGTSAFFAVITS